MVEVTVKDIKTGQKCILSIMEDNNEQATVKVRFDPPVDQKKDCPPLWNYVAGEILALLTGIGQK